MKIQMLKFKQRRAFGKLGAQAKKLPSLDASLSGEIEMSKSVSARMREVDAEIGTLAPATYFWARKPLLTVLITVGASLLATGVVYEQDLATPDLSTPKKVVLAFEDALERDDMATARSFTIGNTEQLASAKVEHDFSAADSRLKIAMAKKFDGEEKAKEASAKSRSRWAEASERIEEDKATVGAGWFGPTFALVKDGATWKIDLAQSSGGLGSALQAKGGQPLLKAINELTEKVAQGYYKTKDEVDAELRAKLEPIIAAAEPERSPSPGTAPTDRDAQAVATTAAGLLLGAVVAADKEAAAQTSPSAGSPSPPAEPEIAAEELPEYSAFEAKKHSGEHATVTGRVTSVHDFSESRQFLFGDSNLPDANFSIRVPKKIAIPKLYNEMVAVSGRIEGTRPPTIAVESSSQIVTQRKFSSDELDAAIARAEKVLQANPRDAKAYSRRGVARAKKAALNGSRDGFRAAIDDYRQSLKLDPSQAEALVRIGDCYAAVQDYEAAKRAWDEAIEASPEAKALLKYSIEMEKARRCYAAIHALDKLTDLEPNNAALYYRKANLYLMDNNSEGANSNFQIAAKLEPNNFAYNMKAARPVAPSKRQMTVDEMKNAAIAGLVIFGAAVVTGAAIQDRSSDSGPSKGGASDRPFSECVVCRGLGTVFDHLGQKVCPNCLGDGRNPYSVR